MVFCFGEGSLLISTEGATGYVGAFFVQTIPDLISMAMLKNLIPAVLTSTKTSEAPDHALSILWQTET